MQKRFGKSGGEMARRVRDFDWAATALGPMESWPQSLRTSVQMVLDAPFPNIVLWGPHLIQIYNDGYRALMGVKHPAGLGQPTQVCWPEVWHINAPIYERVLTGESVSFDDALYPITRSGVLEDAWFTLSYSPVRDEAGSVAGVLVTVFETTERKRAEQALRGSEAKYHAIFHAINEGFSLLDIQFDAQGQVCDVVIRDANPAQERIDGLRAVAGKRVREILPNIEVKWFERYANVVRTGEAAHFEDWSEVTQRWYEVSATRVGEAGSSLVALVYNDITERKRNEEVLRVSEEAARLNLSRLSMAMRATQAGWGNWDFRTGRSEWSEEGKRLMGFASDEDARTAEGWLRRIHPDDLPKVQARMEQAIAEQKDFKCEYRVSQADGQMRWFFGTGSLEYEDGAAVRSNGLIIDITERKQSEKTLRDSERRLRALIQNLPGGAVFVVDYGLRYLVAEGEALATAGFSPQDLVGRTIAETMPPELVPNYEQRYRATLAGQPFEYEHSAHNRTYISRGVPLHGTDGEVYAVLAISYDITERKHAEENLRVSEERFRIMVDGAQDYAMFLMSIEGDITFWSKGAERLFGWTEAEALGQTDAIIFPPEDRASGEPEQSRQQALSDGSLVVRQWKQRKDGSRFWLDGVLMRLDDANGTPYGFAKVARDASDQKRAEEAVQTALESVTQANERLGARVQARNRTISERTQELALRSAELAAMVERRQELVRQLVTAQEEERARIARDLHDDTGQQITGLLLGLSALKKNKTVAADSRAQNAVADLQELANDIAQKSHRIALNLRPTALDDIGLMQALANYAEQWNGWSGLALDLDGIGMETEDGKTRRLSPEIETTIYRVTQEALTNVLRHAIERRENDAGRKSARHVSVLVQRNERDVLTIIEDDGPGFDVEAALGAAPDKRRLGLFGMQERARIAGGTLEIESTLGSGTTVYLRIPLPLSPGAPD